MRHSRLLLASSLLAMCLLAHAQVSLNGKPSSWPAPEPVVGTVCPNVSGTYQAHAIDAKVQEKAKDVSLGILVFLYTLGRLNVPSWMWRETSEVEIRYAPEEGMTVIARDQNRLRETTRKLTPGELECRDGVMRLTWKHDSHTEGVSHNTVSYLELYRTASGALIVSDNLIDRASTLFVVSSTTERHDWYQFPLVSKP